MKTFPIIDLHQDLLLHRKKRGLFDHEWQTDFSLLEENNVKVTVATAFPYPEDEDFFAPKTNDLIEAQFEEYNRYCEKQENWQIIKDERDLEQVLSSEDLFGLILHIEGLNVFPKQGFEVLARWYEMGWRSLGLVWNYANELGGGTKDNEVYLSELGKEVLDWLEQKDMVIDLAHMNKNTFNSAIDYINKPALVSHTYSAQLYSNQRNITDKQLQKVETTGGVVGVFFSDKFINPTNSSIDDVVKHIKYIVEKIGIEHVAVGSDFGGILEGTPTNLSSVADFDNLWSRLEQEGFTREEIEKIGYKNAKRVLSEYLQ